MNALGCSSTTQAEVVLARYDDGSIDLFSGFPSLSTFFREVELDMSGVEQPGEGSDE